jgi:hypothetical protein
VDDEAVVQRRAAPLLVVVAKVGDRLRLWDARELVEEVDELGDGGCGGR